MVNRQQEISDRISVSFCLVLLFLGIFLIFGVDAWRARLSVEIEVNNCVLLQFLPIEGVGGSKGNLKQSFEELLLNGLAPWIEIWVHLEVKLAETTGVHFDLVRKQLIVIGCRQACEGHLCKSKEWVPSILSV